MSPSSPQASADSRSETAEARPQVSHIAPPVAVDSAAIPSPREVGGREGPEPTRFGDWEKNGRCIDF
jgi:hypothetical protein